MKRMSLMAVTAMMTTGAFAGDRNPAARNNIAMNRMEIQQQEQQNYDLEANLEDQQAQIFQLVKEKEDLLYDMQSLENRRQKALASGHSSKVARLEKKIDWDQALLEANGAYVRQLLAVERNDMRLMNQNGDRIDAEQAAILRDKNND
jgi:predicted RNase H-like nuclease (RuvC/YqgF family)